jgi:hypothetical protein
VVSENKEKKKKKKIKKKEKRKKELGPGSDRFVLPTGVDRDIGIGSRQRG